MGAGPGGTVEYNVGPKGVLYLKDETGKVLNTFQLTPQPKPDTVEVSGEVSEPVDDLLCLKPAESSSNWGRSYCFELDDLALLAQKKYAKETNASTKSDLVKNKSEVKKIYLDRSKNLGVFSGNIGMRNKVIEIKRKGYNKKS